MKNRLITISIILAGAFLFYTDIANVYFPDRFLGKIAYKLGLDLRGGIHLVYSADVSGIKPAETNDAMAGLRDVIERRVNFFGVTEPAVQVVRSGDNNRLIVELAGVFDTNEAIRLIGETPYLEFKTERAEEERNKFIEDAKAGRLPSFIDPLFESTGLTGRFLESASLAFDQVTGAPYIVLNFDDEGAEIFAKLTKENIGKRLAIYLDNIAISQPVVQSEITGGTAQITGQFGVQEAKTLVRNLNSGALPIPITLISQQSVGAALGNNALYHGIRASIYSIIAVAIFLVAWYRLPGLVGVLALAFYIALMLFIFKVGGITITAAGIAGFILSVGMAVDANVLIFERMKEEARRGRSLEAALSEGFSRAWSSIRDGNISTVITAAILFWFGTSVVKGFALVLGIGVFATLLSTLVVTRSFLIAIGFRNLRISRMLYGSGLK